LVGFVRKDVKYNGNFAKAASVEANSVMPPVLVSRSVFTLGTDLISVDSVENAGLLSMTPKTDAPLTVDAAQQSEKKRRCNANHRSKTI
jgi:hypothetical protein